MFCPQCGSTQNDELKFCKQCGANLHALRRVMSSRDESDERFDWSKTWVAEMFMSEAESAKRQAALDRLRGITPEIKRQNEIKAGVITASVGIGLMIVLFVIMNGIILSGNASEAAAEILSRIWIAGVIPVFVGLALIFNGLFVSRRTGSRTHHEPVQPDKPTELNAASNPAYLSPAETKDLTSDAVFSVTDETTKNLVKIKGE